MTLSLRERQIVLAVASAWALLQPDLLQAQSGPAASGKSAVGKWIQLLQHQNPQSRRAAVQALGKLGAAAKPAIPALLTRFQDRDNLVRYYTVSALASIGPAAVANLVKTLRGRNAVGRYYAAATLKRIGPAAKAALPDMVAATKSKDEALRLLAVDFLGAVGAHSKETVVLLLKISRNAADAKTRSRALGALGNLGAAAQPAVPKLIQSLSEADAEVRRQAAAVLGKIGATAKAGVPALIKSLRDKNYRVRRAAAVALGQIGPAARPAVPHLLEMLKSNRYLNSTITRALTSIGVKTKGKSFKGRITKEDRISKNRLGRHHKVHHIMMTASKIYKIDLASKKFDSYLMIEDEKGKRLAHDDDGGAGRDASLIFVPRRTGKYRIVATTFSRGRTGAYVLTIAELTGIGDSAPKSEN